MVNGAVAVLKVWENSRWLSGRLLQASLEDYIMVRQPRAACAICVKQLLVASFHLVWIASNGG